MRLKLTFILMLAGISSGFSQITINDSDIFNFWSEYKMNYDEMVSNVSAGNPGPNQQWDLTGLNQTGWDSVKIVPMGSAPMGPVLPGNRVLLRDNGNLDSEYYTIYSSQLLSNGYVDPSGFKLHSVPGEVRLQFPASYGQTYNGQFGWSYTFYVGQDLMTGFIVDSIRRKTTHVYDYIIDGWGTVTTPAGSYQVLRQKTLIQSYDTADFYRGDLNLWLPAYEVSYDEETKYTYWSNLHQLPVAVIRDIGNVGFIQDGYWINAPTNTTGMDNQQETVITEVYPNPASSQVTIRHTSGISADYRLVNSYGREVHRGKLENERTIIDVTGLPAGLYEVIISEENNAVSKKLVIQ